MKKRKSSEIIDQIPLKIKKPNTDLEDDFEENKKDNDNYYLAIKANLRITVDLYDKNKLTKENVWDMDAIDLLQILTKSNLMLDYRFVGQCLEAVTKIYVLRLDSLYDATVHIHSFLNRKAPNISSLKRDTRNTIEQPVEARRKQIGRKKSTVTKNPETLNAKLVTHTKIDPFFGKLNTFVGEVIRPNRMLMNLLPSGCTGLSLNIPFWDSSDQLEHETILDNVNVPLNMNTEHAVLRISLVDYKITSDTFETFKIISYVGISSDEDNEESEELNNETASDSRLSNRFTFDTGYGSGPMTSTPFSNKNFQEFDEAVEVFTKNSPLNVQEFVEDMEPKSAEKFEYTYRAQDLIKNYYYGPSHWKFITTKPSNLVQRRSRNKKIKVRKELTMRDLQRYNKAEVSLLKSCVMNKTFLMRKPTKRFILPYDFNVSSGILQGFVNSSLDLNDPVGDITGSNSDVLMNETDNDKGFEDGDHNTPKVSFKENDSLKFDRRRSFDFKKIKDLSLMIIENESINRQPVKFSTVCSKINKMLENNHNSLSSSCALTLLGVLQAACEKKVVLNQEKPIEDFMITFEEHDNS